ncbi:MULTISPECIES: non-ribosomal peptide synthetase [Paraburkholderia]|uniref:non-ribosomal peptide synthetase n=1 Tax=Paraburkholderia TaxID=1822464 RepID=UPI00225161D1|nr:MULTISPECIES: non-ribosomal peptide synthetase [Paraburkholderia]MCX4162785.1 amino acid adenylation domain-containing protein [Paraburkholderia megapolitana]MDN7158280.1 amino acid adenylation domain-containing protein [Paraburkholderia sp. CHISQ3]MDQ6495327.1 amino acid adenylation domain-containing protein [Paraburkholderia megapolitana]
MRLGASIVCRHSRAMVRWAHQAAQSTAIAPLSTWGDEQMTSSIATRSAQMDTRREHHGKPWTALDAAASVVDAIEAQARFVPDLIAVCDMTSAWTYRALWTYVEETAKRLFEAGVRPRDSIICVAGRDVSTVIALLAIWRVGAVYVPVKDDYPAARVADISTGSGAVLLLRSGSAGLPGGDDASLQIERLKASVHAAAPGDTAETPGTEAQGSGSCADLAYVIYTSGSTGKPKGVAVGHAALHNLLVDHIRSFGITRADRVLQFSSLAFDASLFQVLMPLCSGATLVLADEATLSDVDRLLKRIESTGVTVLSLPPAYLARFERRPLPTSVRLLNTGGDAPVVADARHYAMSCTYISTYGPTEATICCAYHEVDPARDYPDGIPLGRPVKNMRLAILDSDLQSVPAGVIGELFVSGAGLAQGYVGEPELTTRAFVELPTLSAPGAVIATRTTRWYRTGDLVCETGGELFFVGRADRQIKLSGYRIELAEVERALERHPGVARSHVERILDANGRARSLHAYLQGDGTVATEAVRSAMNESLPAYMIPATFSWVARFPLTVNGKVDVQALVATRRAVGDKLDKPDGCAPADDDTLPEMPTTPFQQRLAEIWRRALGVAITSLRSHFFEQGGDSLTAMRIAADVAVAFGHNVSVADVLRTPVFADFAALLEARLHSAGGKRADIAADRIAVDGEEQSLLDASEGVFPLAPSQRRLWTLQQIEPASSAYHLAQVFVLRGDLDVQRLLRAFDSMLHRHPALSVSIVERYRLPYQQLGSKNIQNAGLIVRESIGTDDVLTREFLRAAERVAEPFDLACGPLWRAELIRIDVDCHLLLLVLHHIVCDGTSLGIVLHDLGLAYREQPGVQLSLRSDAATDYPQVVAAQAQRLRQRLPLLSAFWAERVVNLPMPLALPADFARPARRSGSGATLHFPLDETLTARVASAAARHGVSRFTLALAVLNVLLYRYTEQEDLVIGVPVTERRDATLERAVGMFVNTVMVRSRIVPGMRFDALLAALGDECAAVYTHGDYPFELLVEQADNVADPAHHPLFNVMAAWQRADDLEFALDGITIERPVSLERGSKFDLSFDFVEGVQAGTRSLQVLIEYSDALFVPARIERMFEHWRTLLESALDDPEQPLEQMTMLSSYELADLQQRFQAQHFAEPDKSGLDGFLDAARATPHQTAIVWRGHRWSYAEIGRRVDALAARIEKQTAAGRNMLIGVLVERSERFFVAILAIWRAGHAYVPLDPRHPDQRLRQIVEICQCALVISDRELAPRIGSACATLLYRDDAQTGLEVTGSVPPDRDELAYCYFTSGSTGQPKGVLVNHRSVANAVEMWRRDYRLDRPRVLQLAGHAFDVALGDLCRSLLIGGILVIADEVERADPKSIVDLLETQQIDVCELTPAVARLLTNWFNERPAPASLRLLVVGSDVWTLDEFEALRARLPPGTRLVSSYGTTEATVDSTIYEATGASIGTRPAEGERVPLGRPMSNVDVLICDRSGNPMPVGVPGELCLGGPAVAVGYLGWPSPDGVRFVVDPQRPGERMFRTRDRAVWRADGTIAFLGRNDDQIKVRGYRIDRVEIEQALRAVPGVGQAVVAVHTTAGRLMAFVTPESGTEDAPDSHGVRTALAGRLPFYAVPDSITVLEHMPLNDNYKIAVKQLEALEQLAHASPDGRHDADLITLQPREALLAGLWREVLREPGAIGPESSFFGVGGDSLRAVGLVIAASRADATLTLADIYRYPKLAQMAERLTPGGGAVAAALITPSVGEAARYRYAGIAEDIYPATYLQAGMLDWSTLSPHSYHNQSSWRLQGKSLSPDVLRDVIRAMIRRYPALRTAFVRDNTDATGYAQIVLSPEAVSVVSEDLKVVDAAAQDERIAACLRADRARPFRVGEPLEPMSRVLFFERAAGDIELVWSQHHALDDGWSHTQLEACLVSHCTKLIQCGEIPYAPVNHGYREVVALDRDHAASARLLEYWSTRARDLPGVRGHEQKRGRPTTPTCEPDKQIVALSQETVALLRQRAAALNISIKSLFLAALHNALCELRPHAFPVIGVVANGRSARLSDPLGTVGLCWNLLPFYCPIPVLNGQRAFDELAGIESHAGLPLSIIERAAGRNVLLDACLNFTDFRYAQSSDEPQAAVVVATRRHHGYFHFPMTVTVAFSGGSGSAVVFEFDGDHFAQPEQQALQEHFLGELHQ